MPLAFKRISPLFLTANVASTVFQVTAGPDVGHEYAIELPLSEIAGKPRAAVTVILKQYLAAERAKRRADVPVAFTGDLVDEVTLPDDVVIP